jgi:predicted dehydrogenase
MTSARLGFVGCGSHATNNLYPMLRYARCSLEAVCDLSEELAARNARLFGAPSHYVDVDRMLSERELDGVLVVGPTEMHYDVGKKVLRRGLRLFVEKPPAPDLKRIRELVDLARQNNTFLMPGFMKRHGMTYAKVRQLIEAGQFEPAMGLVRYGHGPHTDLRRMLLIMSCHAIDLAISFFGEVSSVTSHLASSGRALSLAVTLRFRSGRITQLVLDSSQPRIQERVEVSGTLDGRSALIVVDNVQHMEVHTEGQSGIDLVTPDLAQIAPEFDLADIRVWRPDYGIPNMGQTRHFFQGFAGEIREFVNSILEKRNPYPGGEDAVRTMAVIEAIAARPEGITTLDR